MRFSPVRPAASLTAVGFLVVSASGFGITAAQALTTTAGGAASEQCQPVTSTSGQNPGSGSPAPSPGGTASAVKPTGASPAASPSPPASSSPAAGSSAKLCVGLQRDEASVQRGHAAQWNVSVWATGGNVGHVALSLATSPSGQKPGFSFGCGKKGTASCAIGTIDSTAQRTQLQVQVPIAATATSVRSIRLTVSGKGDNVTTSPEASVPIAVTAPGATASSPASPSVSVSPSLAASAPRPSGASSALPAGVPLNLSGRGSTASVSPGGNAASLFPALDPLPGSAAAGSSRARQASDTLPTHLSVMGAQYAGLVALALAFVLSATRLSIRRRAGGR